MGWGGWGAVAKRGVDRREEGQESPVQTGPELMHHPASNTQHTQISSPDESGSLSLSLW